MCSGELEADPLGCHERIAHHDHWLGIATTPRTRSATGTRDRTTYQFDASSSRRPSQYRSTLPSVMNRVTTTPAHDPADPDINAGVEPPNAPPPEEGRGLVDAYPFWYHRIYLGNSVYTMEGGSSFAEGVWHRAKAVVPSDLRGASVLDVGCNAGYFSLQAKLRGADRVLGLESIQDYYQQAEAIRRIWDADVEYRLTDAHEMHRIDEMFDFVVFTGILYHLKNPLQVLEDVGRICRDGVLVETEIIPEDPRNVVYARQGPPGQIAAVTASHTGIMKFLERDELNGDGSNWWIPDTECVLGMLRTAGFRCFSAPVYPIEGRMLLAATKQRESLLDLSRLQPSDGDFVPVVEQRNRPQRTRWPRLRSLGRRRP